MPIISRLKTPEEAEALYHEVFEVLPHGMYNGFGALATLANSNKSVPVFFGMKKIRNGGLPILNGFTILLRSLERNIRATDPVCGVLHGAMKRMFTLAKNEPSPWSFMAWVALREKELGIPRTFVDKIIEKGWRRLPEFCAGLTDADDLDLETAEGLGLLFRRLCRKMTGLDGDVALTEDGEALRDALMLIRVETVGDEIGWSLPFEINQTPANLLRSIRQRAEEPAAVDVKEEEVIVVDQQEEAAPVDPQAEGAAPVNNQEEAAAADLQEEEAEATNPREEPAAVVVQGPPPAAPSHQAQAAAVGARDEPGDKSTLRDMIGIDSQRVMFRNMCILSLWVGQDEVADNFLNNFMLLVGAAGVDGWHDKHELKSVFRDHEDGGRLLLLELTGIGATAEDIDILRGGNAIGLEELMYMDDEAGLEAMDVDDD